jgi:hypothetical protein
MMDVETRLAAVLGQSAAPARDPAFTLAIIRAGEAERFKAAVTVSMLRWGALAAVAASLGLVLAGWASVNWDGVQGGILGAGGIFALVAMARLMTQRLAVIRTR